MGVTVRLVPEVLTHTHTPHILVKPVKSFFCLLVPVSLLSSEPSLNSLTPCLHLQALRSCVRLALCFRKPPPAPPVSSEQLYYHSSDFQITTSDFLFVPRLFALIADLWVVSVHESQTPVIRKLSAALKGFYVVPLIATRWANTTLRLF